MVYKVEKHGVRTGNSFKAWNSRYYRQYKKNAYLIRSHIIYTHDDRTPDFEAIAQFEKTGALGEGNSISDHVEYSLNKQRRWDLPKILEDIIENKEHEEDYGIQLVERHRIKRVSNCINVSTTDGVFCGGKVTKERKFKTKLSGGYFQANHVLNGKTKNPRRGRRRRRSRAGTNEDDTEDTEPQDTNKLRYEIHYPSPTTSYLTHNAKSIGRDSTRPYVWVGYKDKRARHKFEIDIREELSLMTASFEDSDEEDDVHEDSDFESENRKYLTTLDGILQHAAAANTLANFKTRRASGNSASSLPTEGGKKKNVVFVVNSDAAENDDIAEPKNAKPHDSAISKRKSTVLNPVRVLLSNEDTDPQSLAHRFGKDFVESECFPRKFIINISSQVSKLSSFKTHSKSECIHTEACIVFIHDVDNEINSLTENVYKLFLNANFGDSLNSVKIETIFDYMDTNVHEIIDRTLFFIETLPVEAVVCENDAHVYKVASKKSTLEDCAKWSTSSYRTGNSFFLNYFLSRVQQLNDAYDMGYELVPRFDSFTNDDSENVASPKDRFCCICYTVFDETNPGTALISCTHWFCDNCWKEYLETKVNGGAMKLQCPEYDCSTLVDPGTALSLISMRNVVKHAKCCHDTNVEQQSTTRWCPNEKCGRVMQRSSSDAKNISCNCGTKVCFECLQNPHWPASCDSVKDYYDKMKKNGDITIEPPEVRYPVTVHGKHCPSCKRFIEKNGGCPSMICVCGAHFCWGCGQLWHTRAHGSECYKYGYDNKHGTTEKSFKPRTVEESKSHQKWYKMALSHRVNQHPARINAMKTAVKSLTKQVQFYLYRSEQKGEKNILDFEVPNKVFNRETDKVPDFLKSIVDLYAEISHVVENTAVLLNSEQLPAEQRLVLRRISHRLSEFCQAIYDLFMTGGRADVKVFLERLKQIRFHSREALRSLIRSVNSLQD